MVVESTLYFRFNVAISIQGPDGDATMSTFADLNVASVQEAEMMAAVMLRSSRTGFKPLYVVDCSNGRIQKEWV